MMDEQWPCYMTQGTANSPLSGSVMAQRASLVIKDQTFDLGDESLSGFKHNRGQFRAFWGCACVRVCVCVFVCVSGEG